MSSPSVNQVVLEALVTAAAYEPRSIEDLLEQAVLDAHARGEWKASKLFARWLGDVNFKRAEALRDRLYPYEQGQPL